MYRIEFSPTALNDVVKLQECEPKCYSKLESLLEELKEHPTTGTGHPEQLKHTQVPTWSRRISKKHRLVYAVEDLTVRVYIISSWGHYDDK